MLIMLLAKNNFTWSGVFFARSKWGYIHQLCTLGGRGALVNFMPRLMERAFFLHGPVHLENIISTFIENVTCITSFEHLLQQRHMYNSIHPLLESIGTDAESNYKASLTHLNLNVTCRTSWEHLTKQRHMYNSIHPLLESIGTKADVLHDGAVPLALCLTREHSL